MTAFHERTTNLSRAFVIQREFDGIHDHMCLVPEGFEVRLVTDIGAGGSILAIRGDCTVLIQWNGKGVHYVTVSANRSDEAEHWIAVLRSDIPSCRAQSLRGAHLARQQLRLSRGNHQHDRRPDLGRDLTQLLHNHARCTRLARRPR